MKVEKVKIVDLMSVLVSYLRDRLQAVDIRILEEENTLRIRPSNIPKNLPPSPPSSEDESKEDNDSPKIKPI